MFSLEQIKELSNVEYMSNASFDDIMQLNDKVFETEALIRESTSKQDQLAAYEVQKDMIIKMIESKPKFRLKSNNIFEDKGVSGLKAKDRVGYNLMKERAMKHDFEIVVVDAVSRLARNVRDLIDVIDDFRQHGKSYS
jgi:DNA invertase Pin-like site-specific DNA recombinase